jgi:hypothetical protein
VVVSGADPLESRAVLRQPVIGAHLAVIPSTITPRRDTHHRRSYIPGCSSPPQSRGSPLSPWIPTPIPIRVYALARLLLIDQ